VERGQVTLDEDISRILPELKNPQIVELDEKAEHGYTLRPAKGFVTLRQLITHTSGVGYPWMNETLTAWRKHVGPSQEELRGKVITTFTTPLLFEPGEGWVYGGGLDWAGIMAVRLNGSKTLGNYVEEHIFKPLGMTSTTFDIDTRPDIEERLVQTSRREEDGTLVVHGEPVFLMKVEEHSGGGGLWSSVPDYIKVLGDLLKDKPKLLKKETIEELMFKPQIKSGNPALQSLVDARSATAANAVAADSGINYGLGGMLLTKDAEVTGLPKDTLSWGGLPNLKWFCNRKLGVAGMYASQVLPPGDPQSIELSSAFSKEIVRLARQRQTNGA
jgi:CubicO group peptidase (beta-lactamase class C family)